MKQLITLILSSLSSYLSSNTSDLNENSSVTLSIPNLERLPNEELVKLNSLLPWASYVVDSNSRRFGKAFSNKKRINFKENIEAMNLEIISNESSIGLVIIIFIIYLLYNYLQLEKLNLNLLYVQFFLLHFFYHQY